MDSNFRNKDTLKIFEERYKANKDGYNNVQKAKEKQKDFNDRLFSSNLNQAERINNNVNNLRQVKRDIFRNKF